jgi:hypothetical protein
MYSILSHPTILGSLMTIGLDFIQKTSDIF